MKTPNWISLLSILITLASLPALADFVVNPYGGIPIGTGADAPGGTYSPSVAKIKCLLQKAQIPANTVDKSAQGLAQALQQIKLSTDQFNDTSLCHYVAQIKAESDGGAQNTEAGGGGGTGAIQVTGSSNKAQADQCAEQADPSVGSNAISQAGGQNEDASHLVSLCWWKQNFCDNEAHNQYTMQPSPEADKHVSSIVNTGHDGTGTGMTGGQANADKRSQTFQQTMNGLSECNNASD